MTDVKPLPHTFCVKGKYWYFRHPKVGRVALPGSPTDPVFLSRYKWLSRSAGVHLKRQRSKNRIRRAEARAAVANQAQVYFIGIEPDGPIKIGKAINVQERLGTLQVAMPMPLALLATADGGRAREREYHARFEAHRIRGEWFERGPEIVAEIARLCSAEQNEPETRP